MWKTEFIIYGCCLLPSLGRTSAFKANVCWRPLRAVRSLYNWSRSWGFVVKSKPDLYLRQGCPLSPIPYLSLIFMDRICRHSHGGVQLSSTLEPLISPLCRWCCPVCFNNPGSSACTGVVCSRVWSRWDENQHLQVQGHGSGPESLVPLRGEPGKDLGHVGHVGHLVGLGTP